MNNEIYHSNRKDTTLIEGFRSSLFRNLFIIFVVLFVIFYFVNMVVLGVGSSSGGGGKR
jgi:hypothetical protein